VLVEQVSKRQSLRENGMHWQTLERVLEHYAPPGCRTKAARSRPRLGKFMPRIRQIVEDACDVPRNQRHNPKRIFERIRDKGHDCATGSNSKSQPAQLPQHDPDFGFFRVIFAGPLEA